MPRRISSTSSTSLPTLGTSSAVARSQRERDDCSPSSSSLILRSTRSQSRRRSPRAPCAPSSNSSLARDQPRSTSSRRRSTPRITSDPSSTCLLASEASRRATCAAFSAASKATCMPLTTALRSLHSPQMASVAATSLFVDRPSISALSPSIELCELICSLRKLWLNPSTRPIMFSNFPRTESTSANWSRRRTSTARSVERRVSATSLRKVATSWCHTSPSSVILWSFSTVSSESTRARRSEMRLASLLLLSFR
mmetsp:Transcript_41691/g.99962  ORF Transcript_41691/g.99962 Transcript_41691/m.99962 type:complete len:254 (-) Transcript_41691:1673-2434(-)